MFFASLRITDFQLTSFVCVCASTQCPHGRPCAVNNRSYLCVHVFIIVTYFSILAAFVASRLSFGACPFCVFLTYLNVYVLTYLLNEYAVPFPSTFSHPRCVNYTCCGLHELLRWSFPKIQAQGPFAKRETNLAASRTGNGRAARTDN